ncbi:hypothetical protein M427DRAFT_133129 [Gonapodya prolifera JEL478]|uniref:Protein kinase domain-containing protein n=1 Tax=Gonapodya prolifera (strain JEL478) TaxID=1344416 RepID=A0A139ANA6_GONPJ|nr:hypothetical protein M427DRAFT_133129 [Gonapodya prolifera JEL478]|eukprot:KXS17995.1 hypothetical protein M427DRAFT_133129 [Gonapodya prolifera JEL478]
MNDIRLAPSIYECYPGDWDSLPKDGIKGQLADLAREMLQVDPEKRITVPMVLAHDALKGHLSISTLQNQVST